MQKPILVMLLGASLLVAGCGKIQFTPSLIAAALTTLQSEINQLPAGTVPTSVTDALSVAVQAVTADATGSSWATIARQALVTVYSDLPAAQQNNPWINGTIVGLEAALEAVGA